MATTTYFSVGGEMLGEDRAGTKRDYVPDPQGNVLSLLDNAQATTDAYTYWPNGELRTSSGSSTTPMRFGGALGYRRDSATRIYVRARELDPRLGRWLTVDPLWPFEDAYQYVRNNPTSMIDPSGLQGGIGDLASCFGCAAQQVDKAWELAKRFCDKYKIGKKKGDVPKNSICNAVLHCSWMCLIAQNCGYGSISGMLCALFVGDAHEKPSPIGIPGYLPPGTKNPPDEECMDLYNNRVGMNCSTGADCFTCCERNALNGGLASIIKPPPPFKRPRENCKNPKNVRLPVIDWDDRTCP